MVVINSAKVVLTKATFICFWFLVVAVNVEAVEPTVASRKLSFQVTGDVEHLAFRVVEERRNEQLKMLLKQGFSANLKASDGTSLLMHAALHGNPEGIRILLEAGADPNVANSHGATALIYGAADREKARLLIASGADVNVKTSGGSTALSAAAAHANGAASLAFLIDSGATLDPSLLASAVRVGSVDSVKILVEHFKTSSVTERDLVRAISYAAGRGHKEMLLVLTGWVRSNGLHSVLTASGAGLPRALRRDDPELAQFLLERDATTLDLLDATYSDVEHDPDILQTLIERGADVNAKGFRGYSALDYSMLRGHHRTQQLLTAAGAKAGRKIRERHVPQRDIRLNQANEKRVISDAVERSLNLLFESSDRFLHNRRGCTSCHHQHLPAVAASVALSRGLRVDSTALARMNQRFLDNWSAKIPAVYEGQRLTQAQSIGFRLWSWSAQGLAPNPVTKGMVWATAATQLQDGHWQHQNTRTPLEDGDHQATALGIRALAMFPLAGRRKEFDERIQRASHWLEQTPARKHTQDAFRLLGLAWANAEAAVLQQGVNKILRSQRPDGGWAQLENLESDSWATGLALLAIHTAGVETSHASYKRGVEFLLNSQFDDGSWFVRSRSKPVVLPHFDSGFPFGWDQWISASGTALAATTLALSVEPADYQTIQAQSFDELAGAHNASKQEIAEDFVFKAERTVDFVKHIRPIFEASCLDCHGVDAPEGNFAIVDRDSLMRGGQSGVVTFRPGKGKTSQLIRHVTDRVEDMEMPPLDKRDVYPSLSEKQVKLLVTWIDEGAQWPKNVSLAD